MHLLNRRIRGKVIAGLVLVILLFLVYQNTQIIRLKYDELKSGSSAQPDEAKPIIGHVKANPSHKFWKKVFATIKSNKPDLSEEEASNAIIFNEYKKAHNGRPTKEDLLAKSTVSDVAFLEFKKKHDLLLNELPSKLAESTFKKNTKGVVIIGGGKFSWLAYLTLQSLRATGSDLPVEIIIPTFKDYEKEQDFCLKILPSLKASCIVVPDVFGPDVTLNWSFGTYQYKSLALMVSTFQHILLLDSDNIIIQNPEKVFDSELYKKYGMITWPDYWARAITPKFYEIAGMDVNERMRVRYKHFKLLIPDAKTENLSIEESRKTPFHDLAGSIPDVSTESGQLFINKGSHGKTLLLSLYYNVCGPRLYYRLFSSGDPGEGDKDTFPAAAMVTKQPYYQVKSSIRTFGYADTTGSFHGVAIGQKDPIADYEHFETERFTDFKEIHSKSSIDEQIGYLDKVNLENNKIVDNFSLFAVHCNFPKLDLHSLLEKEEIYDKELNKLRYKFYSNFEYKRTIMQNGEKTVVDVNLEQDIWKVIQTALCVQKVKFVFYAESDMVKLCDFIDNQVEWLKTP